MKGVLSTMESRKRSLSDQDSHGESSPLKRPRQDSSPHPAREKHVTTWGSKESRDTMILEATIAGWHNDQTDQQTSTSSSGLERGGLGQEEDKQLLPTELICEVFKRLDTSTFIRVYRSFDRGYKLISILDDKKCQEVIRNLKTSDLTEHFNLLKTSKKRKEFLGWLNSKQVKNLYQTLGAIPNKREDFLSDLKFEQIANLYQSCNDKKALRRAMPLEYLEELMNKLSSEHQKITTSQQAEELELARQDMITLQNVKYFNSLKTDNERKGFVRELELEQVDNLLEYFQSDTAKRNKASRAVALEDLKNLQTFANPDYPELRIRIDAEGFNLLKTPDERRKYLEHIKNEEDFECLEFLKKAKGFEVEIFERWKDISNKTHAEIANKSFKEIESYDKFIYERVEMTFHQRIKNLYLYFGDDPHMQKTLCASIPVKNLKRLIEELTVNQGKAAQSVIQAWKEKETSTSRSAREYRL
jgi:hypothetical protein